MSEKNYRDEIDKLLAIQDGINESTRACSGRVDYMRMGPLRSLSKLLKHYRALAKRGEDVPTTSKRSIHDWSSKYNWVEFAKAYDYAVDKDTEHSIRSQRLSMLENFGRVVAEAIDNIDVRKSTLSQVSGAWKNYLQSSQSLFDELPTRKTMTIKTGEDIKEVSTDDLKKEAQKLMDDLKNDSETHLISSMYQLPQDNLQVN